MPAGVTLTDARRGRWTSGGFLVRVRVGDDLHELSWEDWEARVRAGRVPADALVQFEAVTGSSFVRAGDLEMYRSLRNDAAIAWQGSFFSGPPPILTALLVGFQVRVWWWAWLPDIQRELQLRFTNWTPPALEDGEVWRLVTMGLLHLETEHLVLNMMWLAYTGWNIERALGRRNLLVLYFASVIGGAFLSMFFSPETQSLGASGGVFGLVAASVAFGFARPDLLPRRGRRLFGAAMLPYLVLMFWSGLMNEQTDNWSHFGGLVTGGVLALLMDPEPLQRRPGWNTRIRWGATAACALGLVAPLVLGPRLEPLGDSEDVRALLARRRGAAPPPVDEGEVYRALQYDVPTGWKPGLDVARGVAFTSPVGAGSLRAWGVRAGGGDRLQAPEQLASAWVAKLREEWPDAEVSEPRPVEVGGRPGLELRARVGPEDEARVIEWRGATRGTWTLEEVWQVDEASASRLAPLASRLRASVEWGEPPTLREARLDHQHLPDSPRTKARLALALARAGEVERAFALHEELVAIAPEDPDPWLDALSSVKVAGGVLSDPQGWYARALESAPAPQVVAEIAHGLANDGRESLAMGLLDIAWIASPGDRQLRRARRRLHLGTQLDAATGEPWELSHHPATGERRLENDIERRRRWRLTLADAAEAGAARTEDVARAAGVAVAAIESGSPDGVVPLLVMREGHLPPVEPDLSEALAADLKRAADGSTPVWMPEVVAEAMSRHPEYVDIVRAP